MTEANQQVNSDEHSFDIAIVGGGIVGLSQALSLAKSLVELNDRKIKLILIDASEEANQESELEPVQSQQAIKGRFSARVSAITAASEELFSSLGIWDQILAAGACPYQNMFVWDADGTASIDFASAAIHQPRLGHIVENRHIIQALNEALQKQTNIEILRSESVVSINKVDTNTSAIASGLKLTSGKYLTCQLIIGADGGNSFVRQESNFETKQWDYQHKAIVTTVKTELAHSFTASQCFLPSGPLAFLPLLDKYVANKEDQHYSSIVWSCLPAKADELMKLNDDEFSEQLSKSFENKLGEVEQVAKRFSFPLWQKHAVDYVQHGVALIGDAAHTIHPLAGQGVNLGLQDVIALTSILIQAIERKENFATHQVLSRYQRRRKGGNLGMMLVMEGFKRLFASDDLSVRWLRNAGVTGINNSAALKNYLMKEAMGL